MKKWLPVIILAFAQFVMVLDSTVMNVSISTVVKDLDTTITAMQGAITFYALTMASLMLIGGKLGDIWGRKRALLIGSIVYAIGSLTTGFSANFAMLFVGWSIVEGLGAVLIIPAIAALVATNYKGKDRVKAYAVVGGVSGAAAAAGPLIGGFMTTYLDWRYVFFGEVVIMAGVILCMKYIKDAPKIKNPPKIDLASALLSSSALILVVFGMLQSSKWGWIQPRVVPEIGGVSLAPLGISLVPYLIVAGVLLLRVFYKRQVKLEATKANPLLRVSLLRDEILRSGLATLMFQYLVIGAVFFVVPIYLQMTLGFNAIETGMRIVPLSFAIVFGSIFGARISAKRSPKNIIRIGQYMLVGGVLVLLASINITLSGFLFGLGMFVTGLGVGLLASQIGNVNMSAVGESDTSEVGGMQGVFQNLGSSMGTAVIGSIVVAVLTTSFISNIQTSTLPADVKNYVQSNSAQGVSIVPLSQVEAYATSKGLSEDEVNEAVEVYADSQLEALRGGLFVLFAISLLGVVFSRNAPDEIVG
jgi:MFS family permease